MNTKNIIFLFLLLNAYLFNCQNIGEEYEYVEGSWKGYFEEGNEKYAVSLEISENKETKNAYRFTLTNFTSDKFYVTKSKLIDNSPKILTIDIEEAGLSSCKKCKFVRGKIIIKILDDKTINLSVTSVGPNYWRLDDVAEGMSDISDLILIKDTSK